MIAKIVLGLGFGDEGKGMTVDYLCSKYKKVTGNPDVVVVRFNGGQQAGHTVIRDNIKHVHSSFGSGTLLGIPTYISEYCCLYPPYLQNEGDELVRKGIKPLIKVHPLAKLTTPYDIAYNRVREERLKHGSVGLGVGATFARNDANYTLPASLLNFPALLKAKLEEIRKYYDTLLSDYSDAEKKFYQATANQEFLHFDKATVSNYFTIADYNYLNKFTTVIFEGAQGIMLDMEWGIFPNVTYSHCTSKNALEICRKLSPTPSDIDIHYVTRCYQTRHGNGWMSNEDKITLINKEEEINITADWQGSFRVGELDTDLLNYAISCDNTYSSGLLKHLHVTCLDQRPEFSFPYSKINTNFVRVRETKSAHAEQELIIT